MTNAVIDIGTNTLILLIARAQSKKKIKVIHDNAEITRLGQGLIHNHFFLSEAMKRTTKALGRFKEACKKNKVKKIVAVGTAACRNAANTPVFVQQVKKECGLKVEVITGSQEAKYSFYAAWKDFGNKNNKLIVVDIGGGSTEIITGPLKPKKPMPETSISLQQGSVRLTEYYVKSDPISEDDFNRLQIAVRNSVRDELDDFYPKDFSPKEALLVATAGTATTLAAMHKKLKKFKPDKVHGAILKKENLEHLIKELISKNIKERQQMPGLEPLRADVILAGAMLLYEIMNFFKKDEVTISNRGLRYGVFYKKFIR